MASWWKGPAQEEPDFDRLLKVLRHEPVAAPVLFELFLNNALYLHMTGTALADWESLPEGMTRLRAAGYRAAGYDFATVLVSAFHFPKGDKVHAGGKTYSANEGALITNREEFEKFPWPEPDDFPTSPLEEAEKELRGNMKFIVMSPGGVLENTIALTGFDNLCILLALEPDLVRDIFDAVGSRLLRYYEIALEHDSIGAAIGNDDWGFKTQTMLSPDQMREYVIPWHKKIVETAHAAGRPAILHSCGNLRAVMNDIIEEIGYDAKHSFEDTIQPIEEAYEEYGGRIALMGGVDVDYVIRSTPEQVYERSRKLIEQTAGRGGHALGTGNSVPEYVPAEHYFAMIRAGLDLR